MRPLLIIYSFLLLIFVSTTQAQVWESNGTWSDNTEAAYRLWVKEQVSLDLFTQKASPYYGIKTDCADLALTLRIIFSYENRLPFFIGNKMIYHHQTMDLDHLPPLMRLKAFIDRINLNFASSHLANHLTYPIAPEQIAPGDLYIYTDQGAHHTYVVQKILENGNMLLLYSTVPRKLRNIEVRIGMPAASFKSPPYGFRRFRFPQYFNLPLWQVPNLESDYDRQYQLVDQFGEEGALREIKKIVTTKPETIKQALERRLHNSCTSLRLRDDLVRDTAHYFAQIGFRCLSDQEYSLYSTPLRDRVLYQEILGLKKLWKKIIDENQRPTSKVLEAGLNYLAALPTSYSDEQGKKALAILCPATAPIDLREYLIRYEAGIISSNPYHHLIDRWALNSSMNYNSNEWAVLQKCPNFR